MGKYRSINSLLTMSDEEEDRIVKTKAYKDFEKNFDKNRQKKALRK